MNSQLAGKMLEYTTLIELPIKKFVNYRLAYSEGEVTSKTGRHGPKPEISHPPAAKAGTPNNQEHDQHRPNK